MKTHVRLISSIVALSIGVLLATIGIFEPPELDGLMMALNLPRSAYMYMAFIGMGVGGFGVYQFLPLLSNWRHTRAEVAQWASDSPRQASVVALTCILLGLTIAGGTIWSTFASVSTPSASSVTVRFRPIALAIVTGGSLVWLGWSIFRSASSSGG
jgi:hypothetical protein